MIFRRDDFRCLLYASFGPPDSLQMSDEFPGAMNPWLVHSQPSHFCLEFALLEPSLTSCPEITLGRETPAGLPPAGKTTATAPPLGTTGADSIPPHNLQYRKIRLRVLKLLSLTMNATTERPGWSSSRRSIGKHFGAAAAL